MRFWCKLFGHAYRRCPNGKILCKRCRLVYRRQIMPYEHGPSGSLDM